MQNEDKFIKAIYAMFGSWWSILGHTILFVFLLSSGDLLFFTTLVSIEAIYIGIFILMAANREETMKREEAEHKRKADRQLVRQDVVLTEKVEAEVEKIKKDLNRLLKKYES